MFCEKPQIVLVKYSQVQEAVSYGTWPKKYFIVSCKNSQLFSPKARNGIN